MTEKAKPKELKTKLPTRTEDLADDQKERSYYYDDACGYETYDPEGEESTEDDEVEEPKSST